MQLLCQGRRCAVLGHDDGSVFVIIGAVLSFDLLLRCCGDVGGGRPGRLGLGPAFAAAGFLYETHDRADGPPPAAALGAIVFAAGLDWAGCNGERDECRAHGVERVVVIVVAVVEFLWQRGQCPAAGGGQAVGRVARRGGYYRWPGALGRD